MFIAFIDLFLHLIIYVNFLIFACFQNLPLNLSSDHVFVYRVRADVGGFSFPLLKEGMCCILKSCHSNIPFPWTAWL